MVRILFTLVMAAVVVTAFGLWGMRPMPRRSQPLDAAPAMWTPPVHLCASPVCGHDPDVSLPANPVAPAPRPTSVVSR